MAATREEDQIKGIVRSLVEDVDLPADAVEEHVRATFREWHHARVRDFVPILVERAVRHRLRTPPELT